MSQTILQRLFDVRMRCQVSGVKGANETLSTKSAVFLGNDT
jgi:hypothetical protein